MTEAARHLYFAPGVALTAANLAASLARLGAGDIACLLLVPGAIDVLGQAIAAAHRHDLPALILDDAAVAEAAGADGVHLTDPVGYDAARKRLGRDAIIGVEHAGGADAAMAAADRGADYVALGRRDPAAPPDLDFVAWWAATITVPQVVMGLADADALAAYRAAGADFLMIG